MGELTPAKVAAMQQRHAENMAQRRAPLALASKFSTAQMVANVAALLPPTLTDDLTVDLWMQKMVEAVGEHPQAVLDEAYRAVISTNTFAPKPKELIDAVLVAYSVLKLQMSADGERHLAYRKKLNFRYVQGADGKQRFADDVKLTTIAFVPISGVHANMALDQITGATVTDVEKALIATSEALKDKATLDAVIRRLIRECDTIIAHRIAGPPEGLIDGPVATAQIGNHVFDLRSDFLCISQSTADRWRVELGASAKSIMNAFMSVSRVARRPFNYGTEWQRQCEIAIESKLKGPL
jgi:hypothetical protein